MYTETAAMRDVGDVFAADILYHDHCCKGYFNKYHAKIEEIMNNLEKEDSVTAGDDSFKARFISLGLDFSSSAHSLSSIRDRLNACSTEMVSNRAVKQLIIELYGDTVCFTYPSNKRKSQMVLCTNNSPKPLVESLRVSPVQQVATNLAQELKELVAEWNPTWVFTGVGTPTSGSIQPRVFHLQVCASKNALNMLTPGRWNRITFRFALSLVLYCLNSMDAQVGRFLCKCVNCTHTRI